jgi:ribosome-binding factor A
MKHTPQLEFLYDETAERADRLERLLAQQRRAGGPQ